MNETAIRVEGLGKRYRLKTHHGSENLWALKDVSFEVKQGEALGIIGRNGAGKSTLLKILSRITKPTTGHAEIRGRIGSLLEVGTGFHPDLTGRENIFLNGMILGMSRVEIRRKFDEIVAFAEIERFLDTPVKYYSSGMYMRLAFAVAAHWEPEILLVDEVLAVGDVAFQKKCLGKMEGVAKEGRTVLFVSHSMSAVRSLCTRTMLLADGAVQRQGPIETVVDWYLQNLLGAKNSDIPEVSYPEIVELPIQFLHAEIIPDPTAPKNLLFRCRYAVRKKVDRVLLCVEVFNAAQVSVFYANDESLTHPLKREVGTHVVALQIPSSILAPGDYSIAHGFWEPPSHPPIHFPKERLGFHKEETRATRLSAHGIRWPSIIYVPTPTWRYLQTPHLTEASLHG